MEVPNSLGITTQTPVVHLMLDRLEATDEVLCSRPRPINCCSAKEEEEDVISQREIYVLT